MERIDSINLSRLQGLREESGLSILGLSQATKISELALNRVLNNEQGLTFNQLKRIADYFNTGVLFFLEEGDADLEEIHSPQFRTIANQKPQLSQKVRTLIERTEWQRDVYLSLLEELGEPKNNFKPPIFSTKSIKKTSKIVREWLGLGPKNDFDSYRRAIENRGILVFRSNGYSGKWQIPKNSPVLGFSVYDERCPVIVVRKQDAAVRQTFTMVHELGHLLLHKTSFIDDDDYLSSPNKQEAQANEFAGKLLVPNEFLTEISDLRRPHEVSGYDEWLSAYSTQWGVSSEVILRRLLDSNRLTNSNYTSYRSWKQKQPKVEKPGGSRSYRYREPKHVFGDMFVSTVLDALNSNKVTLAKASKYLDNLKIKDVRQLREFYASN